jgi:hypothetical protein
MFFRDDREAIHTRGIELAMHAYRTRNSDNGSHRAAVYVGLSA